jgi:hypothetical protein
MVGLIWKSPEQIARSLHEPVLKVTDAILEENFLQIDRQSPAYRRYCIGSWILVNFLCEMWVSDKIEEVLGQDRKGKARYVGALLENAHLSYLANERNPTIRVSDFVVWDEETRLFQRLLGPDAMTREFITDLKAGRASTVCLPLVKIVCDLYVVRRFRWTTDLTQGALQQLGKLGGTFLYMPACRSLIMQVTGDSSKAGDETVSRFSVSMGLKSVFLLKESVDKILT